MTEQPHSRKPQQQQQARASQSKDDADATTAAAAEALRAQVETLRQESEAVVGLLRKAQTEEEINELRSSVERMVGSYSSAWPRLAPRCAALQSSQAALARDLHAHSRAVGQAMEAASYMMRHPSHGVAPKLAAMLEQERKQNEQIAHARQAQHALALVAEIQTRIHSLLASDSAASSSASSTAASLSALPSWTSSFHALESSLLSLAALDPAVSQAQFYLALQQQAVQMRESKVQQILRSFEGIVSVRIEESKTQEQQPEEKSNDASQPLRAALTLSPASVLSLSVVPDPALPLTTIFAALHSLHASSRCIEWLGLALLRLLEPLLRFVAAQEDLFTFALHFATIKQRGGGRCLRVSCGDGGAEQADDAAPSMEGTILEIVLTLFDFVWQQIFAAAPTVPTTDDVSKADADRPASMAELGAFVRPRFQSLVAKYLCNASIPRNVAELLSYPARNAAKLGEFEQQCLQRGLLAVEPTAAAAAAAEHSGAAAAAPPLGPITLFLSQLTSEFEQKVRERVLQHTKQLVLNNQFETKRFGPQQQHAQQQQQEERSVFYSRADLASAAAVAASSSSSPAAASASPAKSASSAASAAAAHSLLARHSQAIFARATSYAVSQATWSMLQMLYELLFETLAARDASAHLPASTSQSLWSSLRDSLVLWSAITPVYRGGEIESILHLSLLVHNDCTFLARHVSCMHAWITVENKRRAVVASASSEAVAATASSPAPPQLMLVDLSPPLLDLGSKFLLLHLSRHRSLVSDLSDALVGFIEGGAMEDEAPYVAVTQQTKQTMHQLQAVEKTWNQLMGSHASAIATASLSAAAGSASPGAEMASASSSVPRSNGWSLHIGLLLESLTSRLVSAVLDRQDISVEGASRLHHLFSLISAPYPHLLPRHTPSWVCFQTVALMLHPDQSLARLSVAFVEGRLNALTPEEIAALVCALYQDSAVRQKFLQTVRQATGSSSSSDHRRDDTASRLLAATEQGAGKAMRFAKHVISSTKNRLQQ